MVEHESSRLSGSVVFCFSAIHPPLAMLTFVVFVPDYLVAVLANQIHSFVANRTHSFEARDSTCRFSGNGVQSPATTQEADAPPKHTRIPSNLGSV